MSMGDEDLESAHESTSIAERHPKRRKELDSLLSQYGITEEQIRAKAMEVCGRSIAVFKQFDDRDDRSIRRLYKDYERRVARRAKEKSGSH